MSSTRRSSRGSPNRRSGERLPHSARGPVLLPVLWGARAAPRRRRRLALPGLRPLVRADAHARGRRAAMNEREPIHEPTLPLFEEEADAIHSAADRFEHASSLELLEWALDRFHPRMAISAAGGVDGMALIDMAWRIEPSVRVFTLDTGRLPPETYQLFEEIRERYGIQVEFEFPDRTAVETLVSAEGPNLMYRSVGLRVACCEI